MDVRGRQHYLVALLLFTGATASLLFGLISSPGPQDRTSAQLNNPAPEEILADMPDDESRDVTTHAISAIAQHYQGFTTYLLDQTFLSPPDIDLLAKSDQGRRLSIDLGLLNELVICNRSRRRLHEDNRLHAFNRIDMAAAGELSAQRHADLESGSRKDCDYVIIGVSVPSLSPDGTVAAIFYALAYDCGKSSRNVMILRRSEDDPVWRETCSVELGIYTISK